jgi:translation initiation factor IF-3
VLDETGQQLGVFSLEEALNMAREKGLDLVEVVANAKPPVAKIIDYGKFQYLESKKEKAARAGQKITELKGIRIHVKTSPHDLELKANQAEKFLGQGHRVKIDMRLKGREKAHRDFAREKFEQFIKTFTEKGFVIDQPIKSQGFGFTTIIKKQHGQT